MSIDQLKSKASDWLFQQGVSTVILTAILSFMAYDHMHLEPLRFERNKQMNLDLANRHADSTQEIARQHAAAVERIVESQEKERDVLISLLQIKLANQSVGK